MKVFELPTFTTDGVFTIAGRGRVHAITLTEECDTEKLIGNLALIDGVLHEVRGVERQLTTSPVLGPGRKIGVITRELDKEALEWFIGEMLEVRGNYMNKSASPRNLAALQGEGNRLRDIAKRTGQEKEFDWACAYFVAWEKQQ